jgi:RNA-splicing ligase RtcB
VLSRFVVDRRARCGDCADKSEVADLLSRFSDLAPAVKRLLWRAEAQLGTLGGGNHFIEICLDTEDRVWIMLHSGSRHIGAALAEHHMEAARRAFHGMELPDPDLAVFFAGTPPFEAYRRDLTWAQEYARLNRELSCYTHRLSHRARGCHERKQSNIRASDVPEGGGNRRTCARLLE